MAWTSFDESARLFKYNPADPTRIHPTQKPLPSTPGFSTDTPNRETKYSIRIWGAEAAG